MDEQQFIDALARALKETQNKAVSGTPTTGVAPYSPGGVFGTCGLDNRVVSTHLQPSGIDRYLPVFPTVYANPQYPAITGFAPDGSTEPDGVCDDCPGGHMQTCIQTATFGRICRESEEMEINEIILRINRGTFTDLQVLGSILGPGPFQPQPTTPAGWLNLAVQSQMVITGVMTQRVLARMIYQGNPANNSAGGGYKEFPGLDMLINTGKLDAVTGTLCQGLDSDIKDFNYNDVCGNDPDIVEYISMMEFYLRHIAERTGLMPCDWVLAMRPELFQELTACWPCKYLTNRCANNVGANVSIVNDRTNTDMRDAMRTGSYLVVNGRNLPVILDDGIYEENNENSAHVLPGQYASDIYFIPLRARGIPVLYWEHVDYTKAAAETAALAGKQQFWWTDAGRFMWNVQQIAWCFKLQMKMEPRLVLRTPHLAGRIQNVRYSPLQHLRSPFYGDPYFVKGGVSETDPPSFWSEWNQVPQR